MPDHVALVEPKLNYTDYKLPTEYKLQNTKRAYVNAGREIQLTYNKLNEKSGQLACQLTGMGVKPDTVVGIMVERSVEMMIGLLGILKAGGAYLPIDPGYPGNRIAYMLADSRVKILLTRKDLAGHVKFEKKIIKLSDIINLTPMHNNLQQPSGVDIPDRSLAYVIYTSGTTGNPKGVCVEHKNVAAYFYAFDKEFQFRPEDTILQMGSCSFDVFVEEVFPIMFNGGKIVIASDEEKKDIDLLYRIIARHRVNIIDCTPLYLNELNQYHRLSMSNPGKGNSLESIHTIISGGDVLKREYVDYLVKIGTVYNIYGPSEATVGASYYKCSLEPAEWELKVSGVSIGKPMANYRFYILDHHLRLLPINTAGELYIAGDGISRGYLNQPELTADRFLATGDTEVTEKNYQKFLQGAREGSFRFSRKEFPDRRSHPSARGPYKRTYKTGDLVRWLPNGNIEFLGRIDHQVKIKGYRIELGEIENKLLSNKSIQDAVVVDRQDGEGNILLCAYVVSTTEVNIDKKKLKSHLSTLLPAYMIPDHFILMEKIPLTPNGKIDRSKLPEPEIKSGDSYTAPGNEVEKKLVEIWAEVLNLDKGEIGVEANFFEIGGNSLKINHINSKARVVFAKDIPLVAMFEYPTIKSFSRYLSTLEGLDSHHQAEGYGYAKKERNPNRLRDRNKRMRN
jgi:amino acid adenylation domain-containing protein